MATINLYCNVANCRKKVTKQTWITSCSHVICTEHEELIFKNGHMLRCVICSHPLRDKDDVILQNLNPGDLQKTMVLTGLSPDIIFDISQRAVNFWMYQMYQEGIHKDLIIKNAKERSVTLTDYCDTVAAKYNIEEQKTARKIEMMQKEIEEKTKNVEELISQVAEKNRLIKDLQEKNDIFKRQVISSQRNSLLESAVTSTEGTKFYKSSTNSGSSSELNRRFRHQHIRSPFDQQGDNIDRNRKRRLDFGRFF